MLDDIEVITTTVKVLWSRSTSSIGATAVNSLINDVFIEEKVRPAGSASGNPTYKHDKYTLKYTLVKDLGLIFVVSLHECTVGSPVANGSAGSIPITVTSDLGGQAPRRCPDDIRNGLQRPAGQTERNRDQVCV